MRREKNVRIIYPLLHIQPHSHTVYVEREIRRKKSCLRIWREFKVSLFVCTYRYQDYTIFNQSESQTGREKKWNEIKLWATNVKKKNENVCVCRQNMCVRRLKASLCNGMIWGEGIEIKTKKLSLIVYGSLNNIVVNDIKNRKKVRKKSLWT
jgi:hypothetical protein